VEAVLERLGRVPVGHAAGELVRSEEAEPDRQLATQIGPSARQDPAAGCNESAHGNYQF
jgi:hypothetical protein